MEGLRRHLTFANVVSALALVIALGTGGAYAANTVFSSDIVDGQVKVADIGQGAVATSEVLNDTATGGGLTAADLRSQSVGPSEAAGLTGGDIAGDSLKGADVDESSLVLADGWGASTTRRARCPGALAISGRPPSCTGRPGSLPPISRASRAAPYSPMRRSTRSG